MMMQSHEDDDEKMMMRMERERFNHQILFHSFIDSPDSFHLHVVHGPTQLLWWLMCSLVYCVLCYSMRCGLQVMMRKRSSTSLIQQQGRGKRRGMADETKGKERP